MNPINVITGTMVPLARADIDTDQIIPKQFLTRVERTGYGDFLFFDWARDRDGAPIKEFFTNDPTRQGAKVLVTGENFGCGSSREHAVWAIQDWGFEAVVATSFADIFKENSYQTGLLPVEVPASVVAQLIAAADDPEATVTIDLAAQVIRCGDTETPFPVDATAKDRLLKGLDSIGVTLELADTIESYESDRPHWMPNTLVPRSESEGGRFLPAEEPGGEVGGNG